MFHIRVTFSFDSIDDFSGASVVSSSEERPELHLLWIHNPNRTSYRQRTGPPTTCGGSVSVGSKRKVSTRS